MQNFINFLIELQNKILNTKTASRANTIGLGVSLCLNAKTEQAKQKLEVNVKTILQKCNNNPEKLIKFIEAKGTKVYRIKNSKKILKNIAQETGFIPETKGLKALLLNYITEKKFAFKTDAMFIFDEKDIDKFHFIQQFYKWYAMKLNLPGYDAKTQESFNSFMYNHSDAKIKSLSIDEILDLKDAIARDIESINFVIDLAKSTVDSKNAASKITLGGAIV